MPRQRLRSGLIVLFISEYFVNSDTVFADTAIPVWHSQFLVLVDIREII